MCYYRDIISFQTHPVAHCRSFKPEGPSILNVKTGQCVLPGGAVIPQAAVGVKMDVASVKDIQVFNSSNLGRRNLCKYNVYIVPLKNSFPMRIQWILGITRSLGPRNFVCYIRYFVISLVNKQYKTKEINSLGPEKLVCYIRNCVISDLFISSFHCIPEYSRIIQNTPEYSRIFQNNPEYSRIFQNNQETCAHNILPCFLAEFLVLVHCLSPHTMHRI